MKTKKLEGSVSGLANKHRSSSSFDTTSIKKKLDSVKINGELDINGEPTKEAIEAFINSKRNKINPTEEPYRFLMVRKLTY